MAFYENPLIARYASLKEEFSFYSDWSERYELLIEKAKKLESPLDEIRRPEYEVPGCLSPVWCRIQMTGGALHIAGDAEALAPRGILALMMEIFQGASPRAVLDWQGNPGRDLGLLQNLTPNRARLLDTLLAQIQSVSRAAIKDQGTT